jgi:hypothetical protein
MYHVITDVTGEAERRLKIPRGVTERSLRLSASGSEKMGTWTRTPCATTWTG